MAMTTPSAINGNAMLRASRSTARKGWDKMATEANNSCLESSMPAFIMKLVLLRMPTLKPRILALDLGKKRIGMAISDPLGLTAQGLPNLERTTKRADLAELARQAEEREVSLILIGNPINMSGVEGRQSAWVREFAEALTARASRPVRLWDERLTTVEASRVLRASGISIEKRARAIDRLSAVILLQSYLDSL
jgi:putative holliday junction resolvase